MEPPKAVHRAAHAFAAELEASLNIIVTVDQQNIDVTKGGE